jgi:histone-lysine N-methyltransferase SETMAR
MGDETWFAYITSESNQQSLQWRHTGSPNPKNFKQMLTAQKIMAVVFWDRKGVRLMQFLPQGTTINAESYCEALKKLRRVIHNRQGRQRAVAHRRPAGSLLEQFKWEILENPPYSPDLAPSDYHLFFHFKKFLAAQSLRNDDETKALCRNGWKAWRRTFSTKAYKN